MSPLARRIYRHLKKHVAKGHVSVTYRELAEEVDSHPRSPLLHTALGEVTNGCRHAKLPALPAIVWSASSKRPSTGYYKVAHPRAHTEEAMISAWMREHARVLVEAENLPDSLD